MVTKLLKQLDKCNKDPDTYIEILTEKRRVMNALSEGIQDLLTSETDIAKEIDTHTDYMITLENFIQDLRKVKQGSQTAPVVQNASVSSTVKLPKLEIKKFSGNPVFWQPFWESFSSIHNNQKLTDTEKLNYLVSFLEGNAFRSIQGLSRIGDNYSKATEILLKRYGDKQVLINAHMEKLFNVRAVPNFEISSLKSFYDYVQTHIRSLEVLGVEQKTFDAMTLPLLLSKLPERIKLRFSEKASDSSWTVETLLDLLLTEIHNRDRCQSFASTSNKINSHNQKPFNRNTDPPRLNSTMRAFSNVSREIKCSLCDGNHLAKLCDKYRTVAERREQAQKLKLCFCCLKSDHFSKNCNYTCSYCKEKHHISLCQNSKYNFKAVSKNVKCTTARCDTNVLLQTAKITVVDRLGKTFIVNALFDKGSQQTFVTTELCQKLKVPLKEKVEVRVNAFGTEDYKIRNCAVVRIKTKTKHGHFVLSALAIDQICDTIHQRCNAENHLNLRNLETENADIDGPIDILIGCDQYWDVVTGEIVNRHSGLVAMNSAYGWLISGRSGELVRQSTLKSFVCKSVVLCETERCWYDDLAEDLEKDATLKKSEECLTYDNQRYEARLPWRSGMSLEVNYHSMAVSKLIAKVKRLKKEGWFEGYNEVIQTYLAKDYIERCEEDDMGCYIPHHDILKENKTTTKLRIVFDGSCKLQGTYSLNECLYKGPTLLNDLAAMLVNFRFGKVVTTADLEEAFLQIAICQDDRKYLKFLWYEGGKRVAFRFCRLPFGLSCSPFILNATLKSHFERYDESLTTYFYVDDYIATSDSASTSQRIATLAKKITAEAGFNLRKWTTNSKELRKIKPFNENPAGECIGVLGMRWNPDQDVINLNSTEFQFNQNLTKRNILSMLSSFFDPLGIFLPVTIRMRMLFQKLVTEKLNWDESIPAEAESEIASVLKDCQHLHKIPIQRYLISANNETTEIIVFCNASKATYGACLYVKFSENGQQKIELVRARGRVTPIKEISIPRLELAVEVLAVKLY